MKVVLQMSIHGEVANDGEYVESREKKIMQQPFTPERKQVSIALNLTDIGSAPYESGT